MKKILIEMSRDTHDDHFNTADLEWFKDAIVAASGHSSQVFDVTVLNDIIECSVELADE